MLGRCVAMGYVRASENFDRATMLSWNYEIDIAGKIVKGGGSGILMNIVIGVVGALIGGFLLSFFLDTAGGGWWFTLFTAILGSVILLWVLGKVRKS